MIKYCKTCKRNVNASRKIGVGTLILCCVTGGFWLLCILFYKKRCAICGSTNLSKKIQE